VQVLAALDEQKWQTNKTELFPAQRQKLLSACLK
jgi:hypothetical protein